MWRDTCSQTPPECILIWLFWHGCWTVCYCNICSSSQRIDWCQSALWKEAPLTQIGAGNTAQEQLLGQVQKHGNITLSETNMENCGDYKMDQTGWCACIFMYFPYLFYLIGDYGGEMATFLFICFDLMAAVPRQDLWANVTKTNETMKLAEDASWLETEALLVLGHLRIKALGRTKTWEQGLDPKRRSKCVKLWKCPFLPNIPLQVAK